MNKLTYLKLVILNKTYNNLNWLFTAFSLAESKEKSKYYAYELLRLDGAYSFYDPESNTLEIIDNENETLYGFADTVTIDRSWLINVDKNIKTTIGNLLTNAILLTDNFKNTIPYMTGSISIMNIEAIIADKLVDNDDAGEGKITVEEYIAFVDSVTYLKGISNIAVISVTEKNLTGPPGLKALRKRLIKEYEKKLTDITTIIELEEELKALDAEYLKDDPTFNKFLKGKLLNISRKKLYLTYGSEDSFDKDGGDITYIEKSLIEGYQTDPKSLVSMFNSIRLGSLSRGMETQKGGLAAKIILRSTNLFTISEKDCGSKDSISKKVNDNNVQSLVGRTIIDKEKMIHISNIDEARKHMNNNVLLRSPMYCLTKGNGYCEVCSGDRLSASKKGLSLAVTEISSVMLNESMKKMHGKVLSVKEFDTKIIFS